MIIYRKKKKKKKTKKKKKSYSFLFLFFIFYFFFFFFFSFFFILFFFFFFFFFNDTATTEIYTPLHDALPISRCPGCLARRSWRRSFAFWIGRSFASATTDRKSTRLNSSHVEISYAVFCL